MELGAILNVATAGTVTLDVTVVLAQNSQDGSIYYYSPITVTVVDGEPEIDTGATLAPAASTTETTSAPAASTTETTSAPATATLKHCHGRRHHNDPSQRRRKNRARCSDNCSRLGRSLIGRGWLGRARGHLGGQVLRRRRRCGRGRCGWCLCCGSRFGGQCSSTGGTRLPKATNLYQSCKRL
jgi:hypothetical protein